MKWDEGNLLKNEIEKVPRMKIDEPPTPYHHPVGDSDHDEEEINDGSAQTTPKRTFTFNVTPEQISNLALEKRKIQFNSSESDEDHSLGNTPVLTFHSSIANNPDSVLAKT